MNSLKNSMLAAFWDEVHFLLSGKGMPYEKVSLMVAVVITVFMTVLLGNNFIKDAPVAVVDLDNSRYSAELIDKINASQYMKVTSVEHMPVSTESLFYRDANVAVIYLPRNLEKDQFSGTASSIGVFYDNTNSAQTAYIKEAMNELIGEENAMVSSSGTNTGLSLSSRNLFNPSDSSSNGEVQGFLFFFSSMFFTFATIGMIPRLRMTGQLRDIMNRGEPLTLLARLLPYNLCLLCALFVGMAILRVWGQMVFTGSAWLFFFLQLFYIFILGVMSISIGWTASNPGIASSRMILFVPGGFIFGGPTGPIPLMSPWVQNLSHVFPLTWEFHFVRDILGRGAGFVDILPTFGGFLIYMAVVMAFFFVRCYKEAGQVEDIS